MFNLNKLQRMQLKAFITLLGLLLLILLLFVTFITGLIHRNEPETELEEHIPVVKVLSNVWIMEASETELLIFHNGQEERYAYGLIEIISPSENISTDNVSSTENISDGQQLPEQEKGTQKQKQLFVPPENVREQLADITLTDEKVTDIKIKSEKISGKVLSADNYSIEVEGYGKIPLSEDYKGYRLYDSLKMCTLSDLKFGYGFIDFVIEEQKICGILMVREEAMQYIRVLLKNSDYAGIFHEEVILTADCDYTLQYGTYDNLKTETHTAGEEIIINRESIYFEGERVVITPNVLTGKIVLKNVNRSQGTPAYRGTMEFVKAEEGIVAVNEVLLEEYLYQVVPSEMPASYPDAALQAQAVCARTYAYGHMLNAGYPQYGAHVDDSTSYQVYNNISEQESTTTAVKETYGELLYTAEGNLAETYYYSTSCGVGSDANVWKTNKSETMDYLQPEFINQDAMQNYRESIAMQQQATGSEQTSDTTQSTTENEQPTNTTQPTTENEQPTNTTQPTTESEQPTNTTQSAAETEQTANTTQPTRESEQITNTTQIKNQEIEIQQKLDALREEENFAAFITAKNTKDYEVTESWYRWSYQSKKIDLNVLLTRMQNRYQANNKLVLTLKDGEFVSEPIEEFSEIRGITVAKRGSGGIADELLIETDQNTYKVISEYNIRYVLNNGTDKVLRQDGKEVDSPNLLPSAFFILSVSQEKETVTGYTLTGGGYGHGVGMSQNGAKQMAQNGCSSEEILLFFYDNCFLKNIYTNT